MSDRYVLGLEDVDRAQVAAVGGKGANLGELSRLDGARVPSGFCVTTDAFRRVMAAPSLDDQLDRLSHLDSVALEPIRTLSAEIRRTVEAIEIPDEVAAAIAGEIARLGDRAAYAVRSSATAEDLPTASFAGQHDSYLNIVGTAAILEHVSRCWASLFTERAVTYRLRAGIDHRTVGMAVVVQQLVVPDASGVLFTADPVSGNRTVATVEAVVGLGEALVSGLVNPDVYRVRGGAVIDRVVQQEQAVLTDAQVVRLVQLGRRIEAHFAAPQDVEWCLVDDDIRIVQSRPITTLFPVPARDDEDNHVYVSVGHGQMMTDPMKPLGLSVWQHTALAPMHVAGGRLFVDVTRQLASPSSRAGLLEVMGRGDPLIRDALQTLLDRGVVPSLPEPVPGGPPGHAFGGPPAPIETDPRIVTELVERSEASVEALARAVRTRSGPALFEFLLDAFEEHKRMVGDPQSMQAIMAGMEATWWLNEQLQAWLGESGAADRLARSAPDNITSQMGLALLDVADVIRTHPEAVAFLRTVSDGERDDALDDGSVDFLDQLEEVPGGREAAGAVRDFLDRYGMRCVGEIDITRPRWIERPGTLVRVILGNVENSEAGAGRRRFEQGRQEASAAEHDVLQRLRALPDGERKADETERMIDRVRTFIGYREYPKYAIVCRYWVYKQALLAEAERLARDDVLAERDDAFYLTFDELRDAVRTKQVDRQMIRRRKDEFRSDGALVPPRVLTSDGEAVTGTYRRDDVPAGALTGLPVSAGTVEGRARVVLDIAQADLEPGDILVTTFTDPSWTPVFVAIAALVTEVGGLMTHGAVIAREYGLPAVVGIENATRLIEDGQRIRVDGTDGYVEILSGRGGSDD